MTNKIAPLSLRKESQLKHHITSTVWQKNISQKKEKLTSKSSVENQKSLSQQNKKTTASPITQ